MGRGMRCRGAHPVVRLLLLLLLGMGVDCERPLRVVPHSAAAAAPLAVRRPQVGVTESVRGGRRRRLLFAVLGYPVPATRTAAATPSVRGSVPGEGGVAVVDGRHAPRGLDGGALHAVQRGRDVLAELLLDDGVAATAPTEVVVVIAVGGAAETLFPAQPLPSTAA